MRFYLHSDGDSFEQFKDKATIVEHLLTPPVSITLIESTYQQENGLGKRAVREIVLSTTSLIVLVILAATIVFVISHEFPFRVHPACSLILFAIYFLVIVPSKWALGSWRCGCGYREKYRELVRVKQKFLNRYKDSDPDEIEAIKRFFEFKSPSVTDTYRRRSAIFLASQTKKRYFTDLILTNVPFSLRNIWLWTLIIGLSTLFIKEQYQIKRGQPFNEALFQEFMADFLRILLVGVVAYIATNVINELLQLREQYVQGKSEMASLNTSIGKSTKDFDQIKKDFDQINDNAKEITDNLYLMSETAGVQNALIDLWRNFSVGQNRQPLDEVFKDFLDTIKWQFEIFKSKVTKNDVVDLWMLSSLNQYFKIASKEFEERCWLTTRFQFFGKIIDATISPILKNPAFLSDFSKRYEIFTVLVLPPKRFLNYNDGKLSDPDWDEYIQINIEAKRKGLQINRHFLSLDFEEGMDALVRQEFGDESMDLKKSEFIEQLNVQYLFSDSPNIDGRELIKKEKKDNKDAYLSGVALSIKLATRPRFWGVLRVAPQYQALILTLWAKLSGGAPEALPARQGYTGKPLRHILDEIHCSEACKVIELKIPHFSDDNKNPLDKFNNILWDSKTEKALDYFAIREKATEKWVLCYRTVYDKTFDFAEIEILYEQSRKVDNWYEVCDNLDRVFLVTQDKDLGISIHPINSYS